MQRFNVGLTQLEKCIRDSMFAIDREPVTHKFVQGELLLLQLNVVDARRVRKERSRIEYALVFDHVEKDPEGKISKEHWPEASKQWKYIIYGSETIPTLPFSLEDLSLSDNYSGQTNPRYINVEDERKILPYVQATVDENVVLDQDNQPTSNVRARNRVAVIRKTVEECGIEKTLDVIKRFNRISMHRSDKKRRMSQERFIRNRTLAEWIKALYDYRCQICGKSEKELEEKYGKIVDCHYSFVEAHHIQYLRENGDDISDNLIVVCPDHHTIIHATNAYFNREKLAYEYPSGYEEKLILNVHL